LESAGVLPDLIKHSVNRKRPDRALVHGYRRGIPRSGNAWDYEANRADPIGFDKSMS
jgi:hypothetical protein